MPLVPSPPTWGPNVRTQCAGTPGQVAKATGFTFPKGATVSMACPYSSWSCTPRAGPRGSDQVAASLQKSGAGGGDLSPWLPDAGLKQFPFLAACLWTFASQAPAEAPAPR